MTVSNAAVVMISDFSPNVPCSPVGTFDDITSMVRTADEASQYVCFIWAMWKNFRPSHFGHTLDVFMRRSVTR